MIEISDSLRALVSLSLTYMMLMMLTFGAYWAGVLLARLSGKTASFSLAPLGLKRPKQGILSSIVAGFSVGVAAIFVGTLVNLLAFVVLENLGYPVNRGVQQPLITDLATWISQNPGLAIPLTIFAVVIVGPFVEELIFRGAIFNGLYRLGRLLPRRTDGIKEHGRSADVISFALAAFVSSSIFALLHLKPVLLPALLLLAVGLCGLFRWSGSLLPSFVAHATFNSFTTLIVILSGLGLFELPV